MFKPGLSPLLLFLKVPNNKPRIRHKKQLGTKKRKTTPQRHIQCGTKLLGNYKTPPLCPNIRDICYSFSGAHSQSTPSPRTAARSSVYSAPHSSLDRPSVHQVHSEHHAQQCHGEKEPDPIEDAHDSVSFHTIHIHCPGDCLVSSSPGQCKGSGLLFRQRC